MSIVSDRKLKRVAIQAAEEAGRILKTDYFGRKEISVKKDLSFVTKTDIEAEKAIVEIIRKSFPNHNILSEEAGGTVGKNYTWIIDPLDGTTNFIKGIPYFSISLAILYKFKPILAIVFNPITDEFYFAQKEIGAYLNNKPILASREQNLKGSFICINKGSGVRHFVLWIKHLRRIGKFAKNIRALGSSNFEICQVAKGSFDGYINFGSSPWDLIPGAFIVKEAGGKITSFDGTPFTYESSGLLATNGRIHGQVLSTIYAREYH